MGERDEFSPEKRLVQAGSAPRLQGVLFQVKCHKFGNGAKRSAETV
jgi:hypothetical protein